MAEGLLSLDSKVDYVFSGESEETFPHSVRSVRSGVRPASRIIHGHPCTDMDSLPLLSSKEYFEQRSACLPHSAPSHSTYLTFETSRGCWWGQKHHCTFCGLNGEGMGYRRSRQGVLSPSCKPCLTRALQTTSP